MNYRQRAIEMAEELFAAGRAFRRATGHDVPMTGVVFVPDGDGLQGVILPLTSLPFDDKDMLAAFVRTAAKRLGALYTAILTEGWMKQADTPEGVAILEAEMSVMPIRSMDGTKEVLLLQLDGPDCNIMWAADIGKDGTVGEPNRIDAINAGRFSNLSGRVGED